MERKERGEETREEEGGWEGGREEGRVREGRKESHFNGICLFLGDTSKLYLTLHEVNSLLSENCYVCPIKIVFTYYSTCFHLLETVWGSIKTIKERLSGRCSFYKKNGYGIM